MSITLDGTAGITTPMYNGATASNQVTPSVNMKNRLINAGMVIDQRATSVSATGYTVDRWRFYGESSSKATVAQSTTAPTGFNNSLLFTTTSAFTPTGAGFLIQQYIEGFNTADLGWGTANAKTVTLSFWVNCSLTGTFGGVLQNSASNRSYPFTYTISSANTWEQKSVTIAGDTSGTWIGATNGVGLRVQFGLGVSSTYSGTAGAWAGAEYYSATGATSVVGTNGATFYITGVQLEVGSSATSFDYRPYGTELALCQRYYQKNTISYGAANGTTSLAVCYQYPVYMRVAPTCTLLTSTPYAELAYLTGFTASGAGLNAHNYAGGTDFQVTGFTGMTQYRAPMFLDANQISLSAEL